MSPAQIERARHMRNGDRSYENISIATGCTVNEIKDALIPGWREQPIARGRHHASNQEHRS